MNRSIQVSVVLLLLATVPAFAAEPPYTDDFTAAEKESRRATRGPWIIESGTATCTQDDELYKKYKDHGPVTWYDLDFTDATVQFSMKADKAVQTFVFTVNGADGHVFRFVSRPAPKTTLIKAFAREGEPDGVLTRKAPAIPVEEWIRVGVTFEGETATVKIGDYKQSFRHPAIAQEKTTIGLGFSFGTMTFQDFSVE